MHPDAMSLMRYFVNKYVREPSTVVDIGSRDINGTYRSLFPHCEYEGIDLKDGPNVDRVVGPYYYGDKQYDVVISGNTMEHVFDLHTWAKEVIRVCKPGGFICIVVPNMRAEHRFPVDCWRVFPDGMRWLFRELDIVECRIHNRDTILIARKNAS